jgi:hypothetical protein
MKRRPRPSKFQARVFRGIPIREARASIHVQPNARDISGATQESPDNCAYARALKRTYDCQNVYVFKTVAYVETLDEAGAPIIERYLVKTYARDYLLRFDHGEKVGPGGFVFHRPNRSNTLSYKQKEGLKRRRAGKQSPRLSPGQRPKIKNFSLRRGTGQVHPFCSADQIKVKQAA